MHATGGFCQLFCFLIVCLTNYFVFNIAVLPHSPGVVYYHLLLRRETRIPVVAPFSLRIGIWDLFVHRGQKSYTPAAFGKLWTTPGVRCIIHASSYSMTPVWDRAWNRTRDLWISGRVLYHWANLLLGVCVGFKNSKFISKCADRIFTWSEKNLRWLHEPGVHSQRCFADLHKQPGLGPANLSVHNTIN